MLTLVKKLNEKQEKFLKMAFPPAFHSWPDSSSLNSDSTADYKNTQVHTNTVSAPTEFSSWKKREIPKTRG